MSIFRRWRRQPKGWARVCGGRSRRPRFGAGSNAGPDHVAENRAPLAAALGVRPDHLVPAYQIHTPDVVALDGPWAPQQRPRADALVTKRPGLAIAVTTADCGPVLLADGR